MKKPPSILDPKFRYIPSGQTDLRKTFARIRREMKGETPPPITPTVVQLRTRRKK